MNIKRTLMTIGLCTFVAACSSVLAPRPDHSKFFILTPVSDGASAAAAYPSVASQITVGVGPIDFPDYLRRGQVITRSAPNQIDVSEERRWGEPLDKNFARVLSDNLAHLLNTQRIEKYPWSRKTQVDYQVIIDVQRFETAADGQAHLVARWSVKDGRTGGVLYSSQTVASAPVGAGETAPSVALSNSLATLSTDIASRMAELSQHRTRTAGTPENPPNG